MRTRLDIASTFFPNAGGSQRARSSDANDASLRPQVQDRFQTSTSGSDGQTQIADFRRKWNDCRRRTDADARFGRHQIGRRQTVDVDSCCDGRCFVVLLRLSRRRREKNQIRISSFTSGKLQRRRLPCSGKHLVK